VKKKPMGLVSLHWAFHPGYLLYRSHWVRNDHSSSPSFVPTSYVARTSYPETYLAERIQQRHNQVTSLQNTPAALQKKPNMFFKNLNQTS
jgi:hypothetical protein